MSTATKLSWAKIHRAIHDGSESVIIDDRPIPVQVSAANGCRYVRYNDSLLGKCTIMEQNPRKGSSYADRARRGETLSWVMPDKGNWVLIDFKVEKPVAV